MIAKLAVFLAALSVEVANGKNVRELTPPMGWNTYNGMYMRFS